jgi:hypothetical protein
MTETQQILINGLNEDLQYQSDIASKASRDYEILVRNFNATLAELEKVKQQLKASEDTMDVFTSVEKAVKSTALFINNQAGLNIIGKCKWWLMAHGCDELILVCSCRYQHGGVENGHVATMSIDC